VVLIRTRNQTPKAVTPRLFQILKTYHSALEAGAVAIIEDGGSRLRRLPIQR
jgi:hypothetical protein